ncbi:hypothetical protein LPJ56_005491, partial [Coemansia sp. RSA 2599]
MPTPDPNSWFRIQSPALSASGETSGMGCMHPMSAAMAASSSITPTSAQMPELGSASAGGAATVAVSAPTSNLIEEYGSLSSNPHRTLHGGSYPHNSYVERIQTSPDLQKYNCATAKTVSSVQQRVQHGSAVPTHAYSAHVRPSSVCSVPAMSSSSSGYYGDSARYGTAVSAAHATQRHASESKTHDWRHARHKSGYQENALSPSQRNAFQMREGVQSQRLSHLGSESTMCFNVHSARHVPSAASPFNSFSGNTASMSLSCSGDTRDESGFDAPDRSFLNDRRLGASVSGGSTHMSAQHAAARQSSACGGPGIRNISSNPQLESRTAYSNQATLSKHQSVAIAINDCSTVACRDYRGSTDMQVSDFGSVRDVPRPTRRRPTGEGTSLVSSSSRTASPGADLRSAGVKPPGGFSVSGSSGVPSAKSSTSSLKANGRRHSWRHSAKNPSASSFAQKLRSFAVFSWASSGSAGTGTVTNGDSGNRN